MPVGRGVSAGVIPVFSTGGVAAGPQAEIKIVTVEITEVRRMNEEKRREPDPIRRFLAVME